MNIKLRLNRLEEIAAQVAQTDEELNGRLLQAINDYGWERMKTEAATVENVPGYRDGMDMSRLSDAEVAAMLIAEMQRVESERGNRCL